MSYYETLCCKTLYVLETYGGNYVGKCRRHRTERATKLLLTYVS